jgi:drug/metabolite transporter (DMT)-like permease
VTAPAFVEVRRGHRRLSPLVITCLAATWFVWGTTYLGIKVALVSFPPFFQIGSRLLAAGALLYLWAWWRGKALPTRIEWRNAVIVGTVMLAANQGGVAYAEQTIASGLVVAFIAIVPALITIASLPFGVRPSILELVGIVAGFGGVLMLIRGDAFSASTAGLVAVTIAALGWAIGSVLAQHVFAVARGAAGFASQMICAGGVMMLISLFTGESLRWPPQALATAAWAYLVFFGSLVAFSAYMVLLSRASPVLATSHTFVNPVIGMLLGASLGGEKIDTGEWLAVAIVIAGVTTIVVGRNGVSVSRSAPGCRPPSGWHETR